MEKKNYLKQGGLKKEEMSKRRLRGWNTSPLTSHILIDNGE